MVSNVRMPNGVDTDSVWAGRLSAPVIGNVNIRATNGQDFTQRYEPYNGAGQSISANIRGPDGVDLSLRFATAAALPRNWGQVSANSSGDPQNPPIATLTFESNGHISVSQGGGTPGDWAYPNAPIGNQYQILHVITSSSGSGNSNIPVNQWLNLDVGRSVQVYKNNPGLYVVNGTSQIRRKSDGVVVCSGTWVLEVQYFGT